MKLFEILIPVADNTGKAFPSVHNRQWEKTVRDTAGGLSALPIIQGQWVDQGKVFAEKMRPVRIACSARKIKWLAEYAKRHFSQFSIMYYPISQDVRFV